MFSDCCSALWHKLIIRYFLLNFSLWKFAFWRYMKTILMKQNYKVDDFLKSPHLSSKQGADDVRRILINVHYHPRNSFFHVSDGHFHNVITLTTMCQLNILIVLPFGTRSWEHSRSVCLARKSALRNRYLLVRYLNIH